MPTLDGADQSLSRLKSRVEEIVQRLGVMHRIFGRCKSIQSVDRKIASKGYDRSGKQLTDLIGIRVVVYFPEDCEVVQKAVERRFEVVNRQIDEISDQQFGPRRINIVLRVPEGDWLVMEAQRPVDHTFELQIRTVLSEGWHEVEHDLRYKCKDDWQVAPSSSRMLNGTLATLETAEWAMGTLLDELAYRHFKAKNWEAMLRHKFRLRLSDGHPLSDAVGRIFSDNQRIAKKFFKADRGKLLQRVASCDAIIPWTFDNLVHWLDVVEGINLQELALIRPKYVAAVLEEAAATWQHDTTPL